MVSDVARRGYRLTSLNPRANHDDDGGRLVTLLPTLGRFEPVKGKLARGIVSQGRHAQRFPRTTNNVNICFSLSYRVQRPPTPAPPVRRVQRRQPIKLRGTITPSPGLAASCPPADTMMEDHDPFDDISKAEELALAAAKVGGWWCWSESGWLLRLSAFCGCLSPLQTFDVEIRQGLMSRMPALGLITRSAGHSVSLDAPHGSAMIRSVDYFSPMRPRPPASYQASIQTAKNRQLAIREGIAITHSRLLQVQTCQQQRRKRFFLLGENQALFLQKSDEWLHFCGPRKHQPVLLPIKGRPLPL